jgi:SAM-dependent methyltransferase
MDLLRPARFVGRILFGSPTERRQALYLLWMAGRGIDLTIERDLRALHLPEGRASFHANSGGPELDIVLRSLPISTNDSALDIGCGKGGAMITMARYGFNRVDGVDLSPELVRVAKQNLTRLKIKNAAVICCDATDFVDLDRYTVLYMFDPFARSIMQQVLGNIRRSLERRPRRLTIVYKRPVDHDLVLQSHFRKVNEFHHAPHPFYVYVTEG